MSNRAYVTNLFEKYVSNKCTEAELKELIEIIRAERNKTLVDELLSRHLDGETQIPLPREVSERVLSRLHLQQDVVPVIRRRSWLLKVAAAVFIIISCSALVYVFNVKPIQKDVLSQVEDILPGGNRATLVLEDGSEVSLNDLKGAGVAGVNSKATDEGFLEYEAVPLKKGGVNIIKTPKGGQYAVKLPDGSKVWLNAASTLTYPAIFGDADRTVQLTGEAYFEVQPMHKKGKSISFFVETAKQRIEVLGTRFNVNAYDDGNGIKTTLIEGKVKVETETEAIILKPNQEFNLRADGVTTQQVDVETAVDWKNGDFIFAEEDLKNVMRKIARWYNVEVEYEEETGLRSIVSGQISRNRNLSEVLRMLELSGNSHFELKNNKIHVYSNH